MSSYPVEKDVFLPSFALTGHQPVKRRLSTGFCVLLTAIFAGLALYTFAPRCTARHISISQSETEIDFVKDSDLCPQPSPLVPSSTEELWKALNDKYRTKEFLNDAVEWLGGAVRVPYVLCLCSESNELNIT